MLGTATQLRQFKRGKCTSTWSVITHKAREVNAHLSRDYKLK